MVIIAKRLRYIVNLEGGLRSTNGLDLDIEIVSYLYCSALTRVYVGITHQENGELEIFPNTLPLFTGNLHSHLPIYMHTNHTLNILYCCASSGG